MAFTLLKDRLGSKPLVLAGPILRKVTPQSVTVWLALHQAAAVELTVEDDTGAPVMLGKLEIVALGANLASFSGHAQARI
jgi:hypothetical protein